MIIICRHHDSVIENFEIDNIRDFNKKLVSLQLNHPGLELTLHTNDSSQTKIMTINYGCVTEIEKAAFAENKAAQQLQLWGLLNLLTQNIAVSVEIKWRYLQNTKSSAALYYLSEGIQWVFALAAAVKGFTAGLSIFSKLNEFAGIFYGIVVGAVASYFYKSNIKNAKKEIFDYQCETGVITLNVSNNDVCSTLIPNKDELKRNHENSLSIFRNFSAMTYGLGQFGMVEQAWNGSAAKKSPIPFANNYFRNITASLLILANYCVGYLKSRLVHQLIYDTSDKLTQPFTRTDKIEFILLNSNLSRLNKIINEQKAIDAEMQETIYRALLSANTAIQGKPAVTILLNILQHYITLLEIYSRCLSSINKIRDVLEKKLDINELCECLKDKIKKGLLCEDRSSALNEASKWLTQCLKISKKNKNIKQTIISINSENEPLLSENNENSQSYSYNAHTTTDPTGNEAKAIFFNMSSKIITDDVELCRFEWSLEEHGLNSLNLYANIQNSTTIIWNLLKLALSIIPVWPNINGFANLLSGFFSNPVILYTAGVIASISPIGLNYESYNNLFFNYIPCMPKLNLKHGKQPSKAGVWVGRGLSFLASAVVYYSFVAYGINDIPEEKDLSEFSFYLKATCILISWLTLMETKALPFFALLTKIFESFKKENEHHKPGKLNYTSELYKEFLQLHMQAIGELLGRLEARLNEFDNAQTKVFNHYLQKLGLETSPDEEQNQFGLIEKGENIELNLAQLTKSIKNNLRNFASISECMNYMAETKSYLHELLALCSIASQSQIGKLGTKSLFFKAIDNKKEEAQRSSAPSFTRK